ncbi:MAG: glycosyltransferase [Promethearchaeota archaeon]
MKYSPIMLNHAFAIGEPWRKLGISIEYVFNEKYKYLICPNKNYSDNIKLFRHYNKKLFKHISVKDPNFVIFINSSPFNWKVAKYIRKFTDSKIVQCLHEPFEDQKFRYGVKKLIKLMILDIIHTLEIKFSDIIVLHSNEALRRYKLKYEKYDKVIKVIPLLFIDKECKLNLDKKYITFVGRFSIDKYPELFFKLIEFSKKKNKFYFQIITNEIPKKYLHFVRNEKKINLKVSNLLRDEDISYAMKESKLIYCIKKRVSQSGIIPMAYMNSTPIIINDLPGLKEFVIENKTGIVVSRSPSVSEIYKRIENSLSYIAKMNNKCRDFYLENFDSRNSLKFYKWLFYL